MPFDENISVGYKGKWYRGSIYMPNRIQIRM